jgi:4-amino-4-deoxychorismate lyase
MDYAIFNNELLKVDKLNFHYKERSFLYGDGFFETIIVRKNIIGFWDLHFERINNALLALSLSFDLSNLEGNILKLVQKNNVPDARIKVLFWRKEGGLYTPLMNDANCIIVSEEFRKLSITEINTDFAHNSFKMFSPISAYKTLNSLPYILAGVEAKSRNLDDLILFSNDNLVAETISSTIYYIIRSKIYTPTLKSGCIAGIIRKKLLNDKLIIEKDITTNDFNTIDGAFTSNVSGLKWIKKIGERVLENDKKLFYAISDHLKI